MPLAVLIANPEGSCITLLQVRDALIVSIVIGVVMVGTLLFKVRHSVTAG